jgi:hypothetical protein
VRDEDEVGSPASASASAPAPISSNCSSSTTAPPPFWLEPSVVRASDTSAAALDEWTGAPLSAAAVADDSPGPLPVSIVPLGNYAVQISWADGFNQVAPYEILEGLRGGAVSEAEAARRGGGGGEGGAAGGAEDDRVVSAGGIAAEARIGG